MTDRATPTARARALTRIRDTGVVPVLRAASPDAALLIAAALVNGGMDVLEITMTVPGAADVIAAVAARWGRDVLVGAGTLTSTAQLDAAIAAGARFVVTPSVVPEVIAAAAAHDVAIIGGALTPTEILATHRAGVDIVKVFPAGAVGGPAYVRALKGPFPEIPLMATGGVSLETVAAYFQAGVDALGAGGELISRMAVASGRYDVITDAARSFLQAARSARHTEEHAR
jgi:2-dehydro-3-deoxyphosphogluconate aldolase/(4S)-4-hydroxy-2-oxoglutarate aldolase